MDIRPIPDGYGVGFCSLVRQDQGAGLTGYREEQVGRYWNYHFTKHKYQWPSDLSPPAAPLVIDGFSPNLNKQLHVGHLRQLALANCLSKMHRDNVRMVALLGASLGVRLQAEAALRNWFDWLEYRPELYYDVLLPIDEDIWPRRIEQNIELNSQGCEVWDGPLGAVIVTRSDGRHTYAYHDLTFAKMVGPTHYVTGAEQVDHFRRLGLQDKHLVMGLVLGADGKKLKSRTGDAMPAEEVLSAVINHFGEVDQPRELAWNLVAWNFLHVSRDKNVKFNPEEWTRPESPGMYISYTYARIAKALRDAEDQGQSVIYDNDSLSEDDLILVGNAEYSYYWIKAAQANFDPAALANYTHDLARKLSRSYEAEKIIGGRSGNHLAMEYACDHLGSCMAMLGMFRLEKV